MKDVSTKVLTYPQFITQLDQDALKLWESALRNTASVASTNRNACLRDLFPTALGLVATNLDLLGTVTSIIQSYLILDAEYILRVSSPTIISEVDELISSIL